MDDLLKNLTFGLFALATFHSGLEQRIRHDAAQQVHAMFHNTGTVRATVEARGMFGLIASDIWAVDIYGEHLQTDRMPFTAYPKGGWKGSIRHLRLHLTDFTLADLPIERLDADVPSVTFDIGRVVWKEQIVVRGAGSGPAEVRVNKDGLRHYLLKRYTQTLSDVEIWIQNKKLYISGTAHFGLAPSHFVAACRLAPRAGRYLEVADPILMLNNHPVSPQLSAVILQQINPVLDVERDLGLGQVFTMAEVEIGESDVIIRGQATIPPVDVPPDRSRP